MKTTLVEWYGERWFRENRDSFARNMHRALLYLIRKVQERISRTQPTIKIGNKWWGLDPSLPGEPPKVVTGILRANIGGNVEVTHTDVRGYFGVKVGPADEYGIKLEKGFHGTSASGRRENLEPRPYLVSTFLMYKDDLLKILGEGLRWTR